MARKPTRQRETKRDDELGSRPKIKDALVDVFRDVTQGFSHQQQRTNDIIDCWEMYNCILGERQFYNGNSQIYVPLVHDAIEARVTRFVNQMFPQSGRCIDVVTQNGDIPFRTMSLAEHYVNVTRLRTEIAPALVRSGDLEGQYSVYVGWEKITRNVVYRKMRPLETDDGIEAPELGEEEEIVKEALVEQKPKVEVISDCDLLIVPSTCNSVEEAIEIGGSVTVMRRWTASMIREMIEDGEIMREPGEALCEALTMPDRGERSTTELNAAAAGIQTGGFAGGDGRFAQIYETWTKLEVDGKRVLCRAYYGGNDVLLGCKRNPYWCDLVPVISVPVRKLPNLAKGRPLALDVIDMQILANDAVNEGADTAHFSAMPIIMTDPEKNPRVGSMVLALAAVWETNPNDTQFAQFPPLWKDMFELVGSCKTQIFQTLGVNSAMIPQMTAVSSKYNQAEIANEQQIDILTTADAVTVIEQGILTPLINRFILYDMQFREKELMIKQFGPMGLQATMEEVPPLQYNNSHEFRWFGVESARNAAQTQVKIAMMNVLNGIPPERYQGYRLDLRPLITQLCEDAFGSRLAPLTFVSLKDQMSIPIPMEMRMLEQGFQVRCHPTDDDPACIEAAMALMEQTGDPTGNIRLYIQEHQMQMQAKSMAAAQQQQAQAGLPGVPGGAGPGVAGTPRPGVSPAGPNMGKGPPGMLPRDSLPAAGAVPMPRRM